MKGIYWQTLTFKKKCDLPNKCKLHIVQLHAVDVPSIEHQKKVSIFSDPTHSVSADVI